MPATAHAHATPRARRPGRCMTGRRGSTRSGCSLTSVDAIGGENRHAPTHPSCRAGRRGDPREGSWAILIQAQAISPKTGAARHPAHTLDRAVDVRRGLGSRLWVVGEPARPCRRPWAVVPFVTNPWTLVQGGCRCLIRVLLPAPGAPSGASRPDATCNVLRRVGNGWWTRRDRSAVTTCAGTSRRPTSETSPPSPRLPYTSSAGRSAYARGLPIDVRSMWTASKSTAFHCSVLPVASAL